MPAREMEAITMHKCSFVIKIDSCDALETLENLFNCSSDVWKSKEKPEVSEECLWFTQHRPLGTKIRVTLEELPKAIQPFDAIVRIKEGAGIMQDHAFLRWPNCCPPSSEIIDGENPYRAKDQNMLFCGHWTGQLWDCVADGYGALRGAGEYGAGSIFVTHYDGVEIVG